MHFLVNNSGRVKSRGRRPCYVYIIYTGSGAVLSLKSPSPRLSSVFVHVGVHVTGEWGDTEHMAPQYWDTLRLLWSAVVLDV